MPAILVIGGLIVLFVALRSGPGGGENAAISSGANRAGSGGNMPDPGTGAAAMVGSVSAHIHAPAVITPFAGTAKLAPDQMLDRLNMANRVAAFGVGTPSYPVRVPPPPSVVTTNPAQTPFRAVATNAMSGSAAFNSTASVQTTTSTSGVKI
jgi:hypothetical protein